MRRGKSEMPASRMEIEESRSEREERREVTDALRDARDCDWECEVDIWPVQVFVLRCGITCEFVSTRGRFVDAMF